MREIKFRTWDREFKEFSEHTNRDPFFSLSDTGDRFVLQQFTGMKDRNGKEVYEGDIVAEKLTQEMVANGDTPVIGSTLFVAGTFIIDGGGPLYEHVYGASPDILEDFLVVGNIFENPDLLNT